MNKERKIFKYKKRKEYIEKTAERLRNQMSKLDKEYTDVTNALKKLEG